VATLAGGSGALSTVATTGGTVQTGGVGTSGGDSGWGNTFASGGALSTGGKQASSPVFSGGTASAGGTSSTGGTPQTGGVGTLGSSSTAGGATTTGTSSCTVNKCTNGTFVDSRDNTSYKCVTIGSQIWMAENLNFGTQVMASVSTEVGNKYCYDDDSGRCGKYGGLYQWPAAVALASSYLTTAAALSGTIQGVCPCGWHLPTKSEFETLRTNATCDYNGSTITTSNTTLTTTNNVTKTLSTGYCLKSASTDIAGWDDIIGGGCGSDAYGWRGLPAGGRYPTGYTGDNKTGTLTAPGYAWGVVDSMKKGFRGMWWTSTQTTDSNSATMAYYADLSDDSWSLTVMTSATGPHPGTSDKEQGLSVRCVQD